MTRKLEDDALLYLLRNRDGYGVWLSGQATVRVLKALLPLAVSQLQNPSPEDFTLTVNGKPLSAEQAATIEGDNQLLDAPRTIDLTAMIHAGTNYAGVYGSGRCGFCQRAADLAGLRALDAGGRGQDQDYRAGQRFRVPDFGYECDRQRSEKTGTDHCTVSARRFGSRATA